MITLTLNTLLACGGFFMSTADLTPVVQNSERVLVVMHGDGTLTALLEHGYTGRPEDFAWVVPVPETPTLSTVPASTLRLVDAASAPSFLAPSPRCADSGGSIGCGGASKGMAGGALRNDGVVVEDLPQVGPFDPEVVSSDDPDALSEWLGAHGYIVTPEMQPYIAHYVDAGLKFLAVRLAPGAGVQDIAPLAMTFHATTPVVPLTLTATGAEPQMGVVVIIAGATPFESSNWQNLTIPADDVRIDVVSGQNNYEALVARRVAEAGGEAMISQSVTTGGELLASLEFTSLEADDTDAARHYLQNLIEGASYVTRAYTRFSPWRITSDPAFAPRQDMTLQSRILDLSNQPSQEACSPTTQRTPCLATYCGEGASCASTEWGDACICPAGEVARRIGQDAELKVACAPATWDFTASLTEMPSPCEATTCGPHGTCSGQNGFASCTCDAGYAAAAGGSGVISCVAVKKVYGPERLLSQPANTKVHDDGCNAAPGVLPLALVVALAWRSCRRRR